MAAPRSKMQKILSKELSIKQEILDKWLPFAGCLGYGMYSVKIMQPTLFTEFFGSASPRIEDAVWTAAGLGLTVYIYRQKCLEKASDTWRMIYSGFGSLFFNLGSNLLMWVTSGSVLHKAPGSIKLLAGLSSGFGLLYIGWHYLTFLNSVTVSDGDQMKTDLPAENKPS